MTKIDLHYAYPTSANGGATGCYYTSGEQRRHKYTNEMDAINDIAKRHPGALIEFQFGGPERVAPFRKFGVPATVVSSLDYTRSPK